MGLISKHKLWIPKFLAQNGLFITTKKVLSRHDSYLYRPALIVACSFISRHISLLSSLILLQHSSVDCWLFYVTTWLSFVKTKISSSSSSTLLQQSLLCCDILFVVILNFCLDNICLCHNKVSPSSMDLLS